MFSFFRSGSILIISHQERILNIADKIVYIKDGQIDQYGSRQDVLPQLLAGTGNSTCKILNDKMEVKTND